ncbi:MAG TPA: fumarylacetoacetate hydrolase family protein [Solirubrobacterales bacterium]|nr:fumarylacetoacetate hydrolase family protein [Solirubrobacterales bacterium]
MAKSPRVKLRRTAEGVIVEDPVHERWVALPQADDVLALLAGGAEARAKVEHHLDAVADDPSVAADPAAAGLPFETRSLRAFSLWESHYEGSARALVKHFFPRPVQRAADAFERVTRRTFPPFRPNKRFYEVPAFYLGNHTAMLADGEEMPWPSHTEWLDFELELAFVLAKPLADPTPAEARAAIGGWLVLNDWSAREVQADEARHGMFGPAVKSKAFANSIGCDVLSADAMPEWRTATGRVRVDGEVWCEGGTADPAHDVGEMLAYAAAGERLDAGDVISTGTMPGCCGLELDRWIRPGQTVELEIDGIGTVANRIGAHP